MRTAVVKSGQTLWDIAVECCGSAESVFEIAGINGLTPTSKPSTGAVLLIPEPVVGKTAEYYGSHGIIPASDTRGGSFSHAWSDPLCEQEDFYYGFLWSNPECVQADPYTFAWSDSVCSQEEGPFQFQWTDPECITVSTVYQFGWNTPVCVKEEPYSFVWSNGQCVLADGPYAFAWSNGVCSQYYDDSLIWEEM